MKSGIYDYVHIIFDSKNEYISHGRYEYIECYDIGVYPFFAFVVENNKMKIATNYVLAKGINNKWNIFWN